MLGVSKRYLAQTPIKVVCRFKRIVSAFQHIKKFEDRSSAARVIFILVRHLRDFRSDPALRSTFDEFEPPFRPRVAYKGQRRKPENDDQKWLLEPKVDLNTGHHVKSQASALKSV